VTEHLRIEPRAAFPLRAAAEFGFGPNHPAHPARRRSTARCGSRSRSTTGTATPASSPAGRSRTGRSTASCSAAAMPPWSRQVARALWLDHDGEAFMAVGARDAVVGELQRRHPAQRPVLFHPVLTRLAGDRKFGRPR